MFNFLDKLSFDSLIHVFYVLVFSTKHFLELKSKTWIYICFMYIGLISIYIVPKYCLISCFCIWMSFGQNVFSIQKSKFEKIRFLVFGKFVSHQNGSKSLKFVLRFFTQVCISMKYEKTIFVEF